MSAMGSGHLVPADLADLFEQSAEINRRIAERLRQKPRPTPAADAVVPRVPEDTAWMTANEFCRHFKIARSTLQRFKEDGRVEVMNLGGSTRRYRVFPGTAKGSGGS